MLNIRDPRSSRSNKNQDSRAIKDQPESKVLLYQDFAVDKHDRAIEIVTIIQTQTMAQVFILIGIYQQSMS
jgi:hypothetical protein